MPITDPTHAGEHLEPDAAGHEPAALASSRSRPNRRDRHGRREPSTPPSASSGPRKTTRPRQAAHDPQWIVAPPVPVDMTSDGYCQAVLAWTFLFASWLTDNPPDQHDE